MISIIVLLVRGQENIEPENHDEPEDHEDPNHEEEHGGRCDEYNNVDTVISGKYEFVPVSSIVGLVFVSTWFLFVIVAKITYSSTDQYKIANRFDLVIFKPATKNSLIGPRRIYSNNNVNIQNINAAAASGLDLSFLYQKSQPLHGNLGETTFSQTPASLSTNKLTI